MESLIKVNYKNATSKHLRSTLPVAVTAAAALEKATQVPTGLEPEITGLLPFELVNGC